MSITTVKWNTTGAGSALSALASGFAAAKTAQASQRDTAYFSEQAKTAAREAVRAIAEEIEKVEDNASAKDSGEEQKSMSDIIKEQMEKIDSLFSNDKDTANDRQLLLIKQKMRGGLTLSSKEEQYLSRYDPDSYKNYRIIADTRRSYRSQLACCRTKDEVNGMRLSNALSALSAYKKAIKNGGDGADIAGLNMALEREISSFSRSARYQGLPTAAERSRYEMQLSKARRYEKEKRISDRLNALRKKKKQIKMPGDGKMTVAQVENSYLGRKIRKADRGGGGSSFGSSFRMFDVSC